MPSIMQKEQTTKLKKNYCGLCFCAMRISIKAVPFFQNDLVQIIDN